MKTFPRTKTRDTKVRAKKQNFVVVTENEIASIPTTIDNVVKLFYSFNEILEHVINVGKLVIKILVIITFVISIATTFLAYFNIAYLIEDFYFVFFTMSIITVPVLLVLVAEFLVNISFKGVSYIVRGRTFIDVS
ncbi:MAG: hypothetical protein RXR07_04225 [Sulfolobaceae archaeon]